MAETVGIIIALVIAGLVLLLLEILTPSFGVLAAMALAALAAAVYLCFTRINSTVGVAAIVVLIIGVPAYLVALVKALPKLPIGQKFFLRKARDGAATGTPDASELEAMLGKTGTAETALRPSGAVRIEGQRVIAVAESGMIPKGATVKVIRAGGTDLTVRLVESDG